MLRILHVSDTQLADGSEEKLIVDFVKSEAVDFIIHTGDLLDRKKRPTSLRAWEIISDKLRILVRESGTPLIIIPGNHDPDRFHRQSGPGKKRVLDEVVGIFKEEGATIPDGKSLALSGMVALSCLNSYHEDDHFYGASVSLPIREPEKERINIGIAHGVGYVPYQRVFDGELTWAEAVVLERANTRRSLREIIEIGYDIILCGHHRHTNVRNGLFRYQEKLVSLRGQHRCGDSQLDKIAARGTVIEIERGKVSAGTVEFGETGISWPKDIEELSYEK